MPSRRWPKSFARLVEKLSNALGYDENGNPKRLDTRNLDNLRTFFDRFRDLSLGSNEDLEAVIDRAERVISASRADDLRTNIHLRDIARETMGDIQDHVTSIINQQPRRAISFDD